MRFGCMSIVGWEGRKGKERGLTNIQYKIYVFNVIEHFIKKTDHNREPGHEVNVKILH